MASMGKHVIGKTLVGRRSHLRSHDRAVQRAAAAAACGKFVTIAVKTSGALAAVAHAAKKTKKISASNAGCTNVVAPPNGGPPSVGGGRAAVLLPRARVNAVRVWVAVGASGSTSGRRGAQVAAHRAAAAGTAPRIRNAGGGVRSPAAPTPEANLSPTVNRARRTTGTKIRGERATANR
jgi:hypothetical protein